MVRQRDGQRFYMCVLGLAFALQGYSWEISGSDVDQEAKMTTCELIRHFDYPCETIEATTDDQYVIQVDRVNGQRRDNATTTEDGTVPRSPILLIPGGVGECGTLFANLPAQSPGFLLADAGYDVWAMNTRDIAFRTHHLKLKPDDPLYWQWSFDEMGRFDIAAVVDLIQNTTGVAKVPLLGYSQGFTASLVLLSTRPEYNDKVSILLGYAPVANITHVRFPIPEVIPFGYPLLFLLDPSGDSGYLYIPSFATDVLQFFCGIFGGEVCALGTFITRFSSPEQLNATRLPVILAHFPIGTSYQNVRHYIQLYRNKNFVMYNYGPEENKKRYGQVNAPEYPIENITAPVGLFTSSGDISADPIDVALLKERLGARLLFDYIVPQKDFRHLDFVLGCQATVILHKPMIKALASVLTPPS